MKLSTKSRYGIKAMIYLGINYKKQETSTKTISDKYLISESYLEQIMAILKKEELIKSTRGAHGGYSLTKDPKKISFGDILKALEGNLEIVSCISVEGNNTCDQISDCSFKFIWKRLNEGINTIVDNITLADLIKDHLEMEKGLLF